MAVPAHDARDHEFAQRYELPIVEVVDDDERARRLGAVLRAVRRRRESARSSSGSPSSGRGRATISYRLRDWLLSRQRYWGAPIPIVYCERLRDRAGARRGPPRAAAGDRRLPAEGPLAARRGGGLGADDLPVVRRRGAPRDRHDGHLRRLVLVLPAATATRRTTTRRSTASSSTTGCRSTSTSAASSTRSCTCSTRASSSR